MLTWGICSCFLSSTLNLSHRAHLLVCQSNFSQQSSSASATFCLSVWFSVCGNNWHEVKVYENTAELQSACVGKEASLMHIYIWKDLHATSDLLTENPGVNPSMAGCGVMCKSKLKKQKKDSSQKERPAFNLYYTTQCHINSARTRKISAIITISHLYQNFYFAISEPLLYRIKTLCWGSCIICSLSTKVEILMTASYDLISESRSRWIREHLTVSPHYDFSLCVLTHSWSRTPFLTH